MTHVPMQLQGPDGRRLLEALRGVCLDLPGVSEVVDGFGHTTFKVARKSFVIAGMGEAGTDVAIKCDPVTQSHLAGRRSFFRTPYIGHHGWISVADPLAQDWSELAELIVDGYRRAAPKRILARFDADSNP
jgi:predicted DNA-binding protein (MmcQ/YjbR family)